MKIKGLAPGVTRKDLSDKIMHTALHNIKKPREMRIFYTDMKKLGLLYGKNAGERIMELNDQNRLDGTKNKFDRKV